MKNDKYILQIYISKANCDRLTFCSDTFRHNSNSSDPEEVAERCPGCQRPVYRSAEEIMRRYWSTFTRSEKIALKSPLDRRSELVLNPLVRTERTSTITFRNIQTLKEKLFLNYKFFLIFKSCHYELIDTIIHLHALHPCVSIHRFWYGILGVCGTPILCRYFTSGLLMHALLQ